MADGDCFDITHKLICVAVSPSCCRWVGVGGAKKGALCFLLHEVCACACLTGSSKRPAELCHGHQDHEGLLPAAA